MAKVEREELREFKFGDLGRGLKIYVFNTYEHEEVVDIQLFMDFLMVSSIRRNSFIRSSYRFDLDGRCPCQLTTCTLRLWVHDSKIYPERRICA